MPLTIPAGAGIASFEVDNAYDTGPMFITLGVRPSVAPWGDLHTKVLRVMFGRHIMPNLGIAQKFRGVTARIRQDGGGDDIWVSSQTPEIAGGVAQSILPQNSAFLARKITARAGRRGRGRWFVPGVPENSVDDGGTLTAGAVTAMNTALANFLAGITAPDPADGLAVTPLVLHGNASHSERSTGGGITTITITQGAAGPLPDVITAMTIDPRIGSQRRRLR